MVKDVKIPQLKRRIMERDRVWLYASGSTIKYDENNMDEVLEICQRNSLDVMLRDGYYLIGRNRTYFGSVDSVHIPENVEEIIMSMVLDHTF